MDKGGQGGGAGGSDTSGTSIGSDLIQWNSPGKPAKRQSKGKGQVKPMPVRMEEEEEPMPAPVTLEEKEEDKKSGSLTIPLQDKAVGKENIAPAQQGFSNEGLEEGMGICDISIPDDISEFLEDLRHVEEDSMLDDEDYYASLFYRCDPDRSGLVKVSVLLRTLRELRALGRDSNNKDHSFRSTSSSIEDLEGLGNVLDPDGRDPVINLPTFRESIATYLRIKQWAIISPLKGVQGMMDKAGHEFPRSSSPHRKDLGPIGVRRLFDPNVSQISGLDVDVDKMEGRAECSSLEAIAGLSTTPERSFERRDFYAEIADWELKVQKLTRDNHDLKSRLREAVQENISLMDAKEGQQNEFEVATRTLKSKITRLEGEVLQRNGTIASLEDRVTTLNHSQTRLENQLGKLQKDNKILISEAVDLKEEVRRKDAAVHSKEKTIMKLKSGQGSLARESEELCADLKYQNDILKHSLNECEVKLQELEMEKEELAVTVKELRNAGEGKSPSISGVNDASFDLDVSVEPSDIQKELLNAACNYSYPSFSSPNLYDKFDIGTQCYPGQLEDRDRSGELTYSQLMDLIHELMDNTKTLTQGRILELFLGESAAGDINLTGETTLNGANGNHPKASSADNNMTTVVREIHEELLDFRNQLKKSQELLNFISKKSSESLLTKSCPGLAMNSPNGGCDLMRVSISTQTDSPVVTTPVLTQKLNLRSPGSADSVENGSFDKLSDDGSVRIRDDLSIVLEVAEPDFEGIPGDATEEDMMNSERGSSLGGSRPKLMRMANAADEEDHTDKTREKDEDYVSVSSSHGESIYLSLERPLKVTISGKGEEDRSSSGAYRSCHSSLILGGSLGRGRIPHADSDTASVVSEGNTTFGSPFSSPSSPYWTPSQGSSSQETLTPLDGDRTPVNIEDDRETPPSGERSGSASFHSPTDIGRIPESKMNTMIKLAFDPSDRSANEYGQLLNKKDWRELRKDVDRQVTEEYNHQFAQEVGEDADGTGVGEGVVANVNNTLYAFHNDEEAEAYLELMPNLAEKLFNCLDVVREKREALSSEDLQDLERKFNHMAEVFQTEHMNLDQRISLLANNLKESQDSLKSMSSSLKSCLVTLNEISTHNGPCEPTEELLEVGNSLSNMSEEFDLYSSTMCRNARRLGMMDVQNRLHRMMEVMILYVHMLKAKNDHQGEEYRLLESNYKKAMDLLEEHNISFMPAIDGAAGSGQLNNNEVKKPLWDGSEMENMEGDRCAEGLSSGYRWILHLLGPTGANHSRPKQGKISPKQSTSRNRIIRFMIDIWETLRWDLFWPWNTEKTMKGLKEAFAVFLMILAMFAIFWRFFPYANASDPGCYDSGTFKSFKHYFSRCGQMDHDDLPLI